MLLICLTINRSDWTSNQTQTEALLERIVFLVIELKLKHCIVRRGFSCHIKQPL